MSNIDETAKTLILNTIQNVFTESAIEEPIVEETPAEKLRREVAEKIAHDLQERKEATKMYKSGDATTSDEKESTIKEKNIKNTITINPTIEEEIAQLSEKQMIVTNADKKGNTPAYQGYKAGKKNVKTGEPLYKAASHMKEETAIESELLVQDWKKDDIKFTEVEAVDIIKPEPLNPSDWRSDLGEMKRDEYGDPVGGPKISKKQKAKNLASNTPDEQHTTTTSEAMNPAQQAAIAISKKQRIMDLMVAKKKKKSMKEENLDEKCWKGYEKKGMKTMFGKRYPNCVKKKVGESMVNWRKDLNIEEGAAWTKKSGKSASGGLNEKGRKSYERENPGSDLKAPSKKVGNPRRKSFCARMKGMKKKLTSAKTARDPDSRINKSLRAWNC